MLRVLRVEDDVRLEVEDLLEVASVISRMLPIREGSDFRNQMWATGEASVMCPIRSRRTFDWITSTPHFSQTTPRCFMRLYLPHVALVILDRAEDLRAEEDRRAPA